MNNEQTDLTEQTNIAPETASQLVKIQSTNIPFYLILWGIIFFLFYGLLFLEKMSPSFEGINNLLIVLFPIGIVLSFFYRKKTTKKESLSRRLFLFCWGGVALCLIIWLINNDIYQSDIYLALTLLLFGLASFIIGGVTKFTPALIGGLIGILLSAIMPSIILPYQYLTAATGVLCCFLIPGLILRYQIQQKK